MNEFLNELQVILGLLGFFVIGVFYGIHITLKK